MTWKTFFSSEFCNPENAAGFRNRLLFAVRSSIGALPTEIWRLWCSQFEKEVVSGSGALVYYPKVGSSLSESKNAKGGVEAVRYRIRFIPIHYIVFFHCKFNIHQSTQSYFIARQVADVTCSRFFSGFSDGKTSWCLYLFQKSAPRIEHLFYYCEVDLQQALDKREWRINTYNNAWTSCNRDITPYNFRLLRCGSCY